MKGGAKDGAVTDPAFSFDGQFVYYSYFPDVTAGQLSTQRGNLPLQGADIYRMHLGTRQIQRLTFRVFTPNTGAGNWLESNPVAPPAQYNRLGYGILNLGASPLPGGKIIFTSNRNGFIPSKGHPNPTLQLLVMDWDGGRVSAIAPPTIGSALRPTALANGRLMFSTFETQGLRDSRDWALWVIRPDGRLWEPLVSPFKEASSFQFATRLGNGDIVIEEYSTSTTGASARSIGCRRHGGRHIQHPCRPRGRQPDRHPAGRPGRLLQLQLVLESHGGRAVEPGFFAFFELNTFDIGLDPPGPML